MPRSLPVRILGALLWGATTTVQIVVWLAQLLQAAGLYLWLRTCGGIVLFSAILMPGFAAMARRLATAPPTVLLHDIPYGSERRQFLDVYLPQTGEGARRVQERRDAGLPLRPDEDAEDDDNDAPAVAAEGGAPVVVFLAGGGWTIGYKYWGAGLAFRLAERGVVVMTADYRQFPQASCEGMVADAGLALHWAVHHCHRFGGDPRRVVLVGQSAGAHLATLHVARAIARLRYLEEGGRASGLPEPPKCPSGTTLPAAVVALSGVFSLSSALSPFRRRGMTSAMVAGIFGGDDDASLAACSPLELFESLAGTAARRPAPGSRHKPAPAPAGPAAAGGVSDAPALPASALETPAGLSPASTPRSGGPALADALAEEAALDAVAPRSPGTSGTLEAARRRLLIVLLHGEQDSVASPTQSDHLFRELRAGGWRCALGVYRGATHTSPLIEDAMRGPDFLVEDVHAVCRIAGTARPASGSVARALSFDGDAAPADKAVVKEQQVLHADPGRPVFGGDVQVHPRLNPDALIDLAKRVNPF